jgi:hypothetical protein
MTKLEGKELQQAIDQILVEEIALGERISDVEWQKLAIIYRSQKLFYDGYKRDSLKDLLHMTAQFDSTLKLDIKIAVGNALKNLLCARASRVLGNDKYGTALQAKLQNITFDFKFQYKNKHIQELTNLITEAYNEVYPEINKPTPPQPEAPEPEPKPQPAPAQKEKVEEILQKVQKQLKDNQITAEAIQKLIQQLNDAENFNATAFETALKKNKFLSQYITINTTINARKVDFDAKKFPEFKKLFDSRTAGEKAMLAFGIIAIAAAVCGAVAVISLLVATPVLAPIAAVFAPLAIGSLGAAELLAIGTGALALTGLGLTIGSGSNRKNSFVKLTSEYNKEVSQSPKK